MYNVIIIALSGALMALFLDDLMEEGMLLERWGAWVRDESFWKKPLGGCVFCMAVWVTMGMFLLHSAWFMGWQFLTSIATAHFLLRMFVKFDTE